jgi:uncharacterized protein YndB with AHSA1/START domain
MPRKPEYGRDNMTGNHLALTTTTIHAPIAAVWKALVDPQLIKQYLYGTEATSAWKVGSAITNTGEWEGEPYEDRGTILDLTEPTLFRSTYFSPRGGKQDIPENYHTITWKLSDLGDETGVELTQDNNESEDAARASEANWKRVLDELTKLLESN